MEVKDALSRLRLVEVQELPAHARGLPRTLFPHVLHDLLPELVLPPWPSFLSFALRILLCGCPEHEVLVDVADYRFESPLQSFYASPQFAPVNMCRPPPLTRAGYPHTLEAMSLAYADEDCGWSA